MEPNTDEWITPFKIGELFMNRFYFEEKASFKIVKIFELVETSRDLSESNPKHIADMKKYRNWEYKRLKKAQNKKGMNLST